MEASESSKSHRKWYSEEGSDKGRSCGQEISEKRKHLSGDEDGYQGRKEMRSKQIRNSPDERPEKISSSGYQDRELECSQKSRDDTGAEGKEVADDGQRESLRNSSSETSGHECFQRKIRSKIDDSYDGETEKMKDRNSRYPERKESIRDEAHKSHEPDWSPREWDESGSAWKREGNDYMGRNDLGSGKVSDMQDESSKERTDPRNGLSETKSRAVDLKFDKAFKSTYDEEKRVYQERNKNRGRYEVQEKESRNSSIIREEKLGNPRDDKQRMSQEKPIAFIEDLYSNDRGITRGHGDNEDEDSRRPWSPERSVRLRQQSESELNYGKIISFKEKDLEKEVYRNERSKVRDNSWSDRNKDPEGSKDIWNRRQNNDNFREVAYGEFGFSQEKGWESQRQDHERIDKDELNNRPGYRKANWVEGGKTNYESSDSIEIQFQFQKHNFTSTISDEHCVYPSEDRSKVYSTCPREDIQEKYSDDGSPLPENIQIQAEMGRGQGSIATFSRGGGPSPISASQTPFGNYQGLGGFGQGPPEGAKANRFGRAGSGRMSGRKGQRMSIPMPTMGPPSGSLALPHGPMRPLGPSMSPASPPIGVCIPQFTGPNGWPGTQGIDMNVLAMSNVWPGAQGVDMKVLAMPNVWPGAQGVDMNVLAIPPGFFPFLSGPSPSGFLPNMRNDPNAAMYFRQLGHARGVSSNMSGPVFNSRGTMGRGISHDKAPGGWARPKNSDHPGKAPSRGERNDYSQNFVDTGLRPQNFIRELDLTCVVEDYPKLGELIQKKDEIVAKSVFPPMYYKCDLREFPLSPEFFGTKFDAILVDPPWEEYVHRAPGVADNREYWTFEEIMNLKIEAIADTPSFIFLWVGDGIGRHQGRQCLKKWGFRRCEDICWVKTNKSNATPGLQHDAQTLFQHSKEHCLMGIKGTVRRGPDGHIIHANIDTDVIVAEEPPYGSTKKPEDIYRIIEHFSLGCRRLELFGGDRNIRSGWLTLGKGLSSSNFNAEGYTKNFADKDGKVWQGGGGRIPPPGAPHLVVTTPDIEGLRPKSPLPKHQQQPPSMSLSAPTNSINRKSTGSSLQDQTIICVNQEVTRSTTTTSAHRTCPPEILALPSGDGYNTSAWT